MEDALESEDSDETARVDERVVAPVTASVPLMEVLPSVAPPTASVVENRSVEEAVVEKKLVEVEFVVTRLVAERFVEVALVVVPLTENRLVMVEEAALIKIPLSVVVGERVMPSESSSNVLPNISDGLA